MITEPELTKSYAKNLTILQYFTFCDNLKFFGAFRTVYFGIVLGSNFMAGVLLSIYIFSNVVADVPLGAFSDIYGKKKTLVLGAICSFLGVLVYVFSQKFEFLIFGAILEGISMACFSGNNDAIIFESIELNNKQDKSKKLDFNLEYGKIMSYFQIAIALASFSSLLIGFNIQWLVYLSLPFLFTNIILSFQIIDLPIHTQHIDPFRQFWHQIRTNINELFSNKTLTQIGVLNALEYAFSETTYYFRSNFVASLWATQYIGISKVISSLMATISFRIGGKVIDRFSLKKSLVCGSLFTRLIDIISTLLNNLLSPFLMGFSSIFYGIITISKTSLLQDQLNNTNRATIPSFISLLGNLLFSLFSILFGYLSDYYGIFWAFMIFQLAYLLVNMSYISINIKEKVLANKEN